MRTLGVGAGRKPTKITRVESGFCSEARTPPLFISRSTHRRPTNQFVYRTSFATLHSLDHLAPVAENEGQTAVFKRRHSERICVVVKMARVFLVQHALQKALAQRQQVRQGVLFDSEDKS